MAQPQGNFAWPTRLGQVLQASGMTVLELAECVGADRKHVSDHLCGRRLPTPRRLAEYALAIGCEIDEIYDTERVGL